MPWLHYVSWFFGGMFLTNAIPHSVAGTQGHPFQSPFANPPGKGLSSSTVNALWGFANLVIAYLLVFHVGDFDVRAIDAASAFGAGILVMSVMAARIFGPLHGGSDPASAASTTTKGT